MPGHPLDVAPRNPEGFQSGGVAATTRLIAAGVVTFAVAHAVFIATGVRYQVPLEGYWEYVDRPLLTTRLLESLFYLHSQPPLFNLFLGIVLKWFPSGYEAAFYATYLMAGLALYLVTMLLMRRLGVSSALAFVAGTALMISPAFVLYEHLLFYMLPIATLIVVSHLVLHEGLTRRRPGRLVAFFGIVAILGALQSVFHFAYYVAVGVTVVACCPGDRRKLLWASFPPLLALALVYAKKFYLFGSLTMSSWSGMHMADMTTAFLPAAERARLVADGRFSPVSLIPPFSPIQAYPARYLAIPAWAARVPVLSTAHRQSGATNYHHLAYLAISREYGEDARRTVLTHPGTVVSAPLRSWAAYFKPSSEYFGFGRNRALLERWRRFHAEVVDGQALWPRHWRPHPDRPGVFLLLVLPMVWTFGAFAAWRGRTGPVYAHASTAGDARSDVLQRRLRRGRRERLDRGRKQPVSLRDRSSLDGPAGPVRRALALAATPSLAPGVGAALEVTRLAYLAFRSRSGGAEVCLLSLLDGLDRTRFTPLVVLSGPGPLADDLRQREIPLIFEPRMQYIVRGASSPIAVGVNITAFIRVERSLRRLVAEHRIDLVHAFVTPALKYGGIVARRASIGAVASMHDRLIPPFSWLKRRVIATNVNLFYDRLIVPSLASQAAVLGAGVDPAKLALVPNGVDTRRFVGDPADRARTRAALGFAPGTPVVGRVGRFMPLKGHDVLLRALDGVRRRRDDVCCLIVGDAVFEDEQDWKVRVRKLGA
jgi:hypothetical protein